MCQKMIPKVQSMLKVAYSFYGKTAQKSFVCSTIFFDCNAKILLRSTNFFGAQYNVLVYSKKYYVHIYRHFGAQFRSLAVFYGG